MNFYCFAYFNYWDIGIDSTFNAGYSWISAGDNYDPGNPPTVTITSLASYGSGVEFRAEVSSTGVINNLELINSGNGYARNINDYKSNGTISTQGGDYGSTGDTYFSNVLPGEVFISNVYYGTGLVTDLD